MTRFSRLNVQKAALFIYLVSLAIGIYYTAHTITKETTVSSDIIAELVVDNIPNESDQDSKSKKKFGYQFFGEEDDDDSAREFYCERVTLPRFAGYTSPNKRSVYLSNPRNINTPPPRS